MYGVATISRVTLKGPVGQLALARHLLVTLRLKLVRKELGVPLVEHFRVIVVIGTAEAVLT